VIPAGHYIVLGVTDTGTGILPEHLDRIFEPFFTTKEAGHGTGLGLSTIYGIIKQSGGYILVYSEAGLGTTFNVFLPRVDEPAETIAPAQQTSRNLHGTETVLVVEDDRSVCTLTANILGQHGYKVITANSAEEALRRAGEFEDAIHLLLTDIVMAKTSGIELARQLKERRPGLSVLYMSGYPYFSVSGASVMDFRETILAKPFTPSELLRAIRTCLDREVLGKQKAG
jgi:CheY-like chemotaxis protein